jgi:hypothetical protein
MNFLLTLTRALPLNPSQTYSSLLKQKGEDHHQLILVIQYQSYRQR